MEYYKKEALARYLDINTCDIVADYYLTCLFKTESLGDYIVLTGEELDFFQIEETKELMYSEMQQNKVDIEDVSYFIYKDN